MGIEKLIEDIKKEQFCEGCKFLDITEEEQNKIYEEKDIRMLHVCNKLHKRLFHNGYHPLIQKDIECIKHNYKECS